MTAEPPPETAPTGENEPKWGVTWVGGVLLYDTEDEARRKRKAFGSGQVIPPGEGKP